MKRKHEQFSPHQLSWNKTLHLLGWSKDSTVSLTHNEVLSQSGASTPHTILRWALVLWRLIKTAMGMEMHNCLYLFPTKCKWVRLKPIVFGQNTTVGFESTVLDIRHECNTFSCVFYSELKLSVCVCWFNCRYCAQPAWITSFEARVKRQNREDGGDCTTMCFWLEKKLRKGQ